MNTAISALTRTAHSIRGAISCLVTRLTRRAEIKVRLSVSVPPVLKLVVDYKADLRSRGQRQQFEYQPPSQRLTAWPPDLVSGGLV